MTISADFLNRLAKCEQKLNRLQFRPIEGASFLDIGAGCGNMLIAAAKAGAKRSVGIEPFPWLIYMTPEQHQQALRDYGEAIRQSGVDPSIIEMRECGIEQVTDLEDEFDVVYIFDVLEHVPDPELTFRQAFRMTAPGGYCYTSTAPLYYSPNGHHFAKYLDESIDPAWVHLKPEAADVISRLAPHKQRGFANLNKVTASELLRCAQAAGFELLRKKTKRSGEERLAELRAAVPELSISDEDLVTTQLTAVFRKAA